MKLSHDEEVFLRHWVYDEAHYEAGPGPAKRLQVERHAIPAELAVLLAAAMPDLAEQAAAGMGPPPVEPPHWPWTGDTLGKRLDEARSILAEKRIGGGTFRVK